MSENENIDVHIRLPRHLLFKLRIRAGQVDVSVNQLIIAYILFLVEDDGFHMALRSIRGAKRWGERI